MNPLQQLQEDVCALLMGNPATNMVPFSVYRKMVIQSVQDEAQAAWRVRINTPTPQIGLASLVLMPSLRVVTPNVPGPQYDVSIIVRTFHDPKINNTGLSAEDVALMNLSWLDGVIMEDLTQLHGDDRGDALKPNYDYPGLLVYDSTLVGPMPRPLSLRTVSPNFTDDGAGNVTLSCSDAQAVIYYTTDGSAPVPPANAGEQIAPGQTSTVLTYSAPFPVVSGTVVKCVAWNPALLPSDVAKGTVSIP